MHRLLFISIALLMLTTSGARAGNDDLTAGIELGFMAKPSLTQFQNDREISALPAYVPMGIEMRNKNGLVVFLDMSIVNALLAQQLEIDFPHALHDTNSDPNATQINNVDTSLRLSYPFTQFMFFKLGVMASVGGFWRLAYKHTNDSDPEHLGGGMGLMANLGPSFYTALGDWLSIDGGVMAGPNFFLDDSSASFEKKVGGQWAALVNMNGEVIPNFAALRLSVGANIYAMPLILSGAWPETNQADLWIRGGLMLNLVGLVDFVGNTLDAFF